MAIKGRVVSGNTDYDVGQDADVTLTEAGLLRVGGSFGIDQTTPGTTNAVFATSDYSVNEDDPHTTGDALAGIAAVRRDVAASSTATDGDYGTVNHDALGRLWVNPGEILRIPSTPTIQAAAYATGDLVGGKQTLASAALIASGGGIVQSVTLSDLAKQSITTDVVFFSADPSATTFTENAAFDPDDADLLKIVGVVQIAEWFAFNDSSVGQAANIGLAFKLTSGTSLYAAMVTRGAPTYASTSDLTLTVRILAA